MILPSQQFTSRWHTAALVGQLTALKTRYVGGRNASTARTRKRDEIGGSNRKRMHNGKRDELGARNIKIASQL